ncbi:MAG TPA: branched-chain amino acid ABC transporter permease [Gaiellaceae bacterium]|nr:branched-chain amino acid ABC transporter permease [Gaiellaceae bacterium]
MRELAQLIANGLVTGSIIAIAAVGLSLVYGILKIVNFAHGEYLTFGAFMAFAVNVTWGAPMVAAVLFAMVTTALLGIIIELILWRPMRRKGAGVISLFITSIGVALVLRHVIFLEWGARPRRFDVDVFQVYDLGIIRLSLSQIVVIAVAFSAIAVVGLILARTKLGKSMRALSDDPQLASVAGIDTDRVILYTWILGASLAGLAGVLQGLVQNSFNPNMGFTLLLPIFAAVVLGGIGSAYGALAGGIFLGLAMEVSTWSELAGGIRPVYKPAVAFTVLILALLIRPQGLFGKARTV